MSTPVTTQLAPSLPATHNQSPPQETAIDVWTLFFISFLPFSTLIVPRQILVVAAREGRQVLAGSKGIYRAWFAQLAT
jgi:hypothetical protein